LIPGLALSGNSLGQVVHTHVPLSPSSIIWYRSKGGWEGNRRLEVALVASRTLAVHPLIQEVTARGRETSTPLHFSWGMAHFNFTDLSAVELRVIGFTVGCGISSFGNDLC